MPTFTGTPRHQGGFVLQHVIALLMRPMLPSDTNKQHPPNDNNNNNNMRTLVLILSLMVAGMTQANIRGLDEEEEESYQSKPPFENYHIWKSKEIKEKLDVWKDQYPDFFRLTSSQEKYGLPAAGGSKDCPFHAEQGCHNFIVTIQDFVTHPEGSDTFSNLPEVFWSGCLHGNERVGPTSVMQAASLLLEAASCEARPRNNQHEELMLANQCREDLKERGIDDFHRRWLARLVSTRRIVMTPTTNALGYFRDERTEEDVDPNRDFPYDVKDPEDCMQTIAGRTINEIYRDHMFQLALTFHAGMEVVGYEWGAPTWLGSLSPDDTAQSSIGSAYSRYGGGWSASDPYNFGTMNDLVYYVRGGMEDWSYAGSWDPERVVACEPTTFGGYDKEKTIYNNSTLRIFNMLIETSDDKEPHLHLGNSLDVLNHETVGNGHISRNIRLALLAAELVEPYVSVFKVNQLLLSDDIVPLSESDERHCKEVMTAKNAKEVLIQWTVGGAMTIDNTEIWYAKWEDINSDKLHCMQQATDMDGFKKGAIIGATNGTGYFSPAGPSPTPNADQPNGPIFTGKITIPEGIKSMDQLVIIVSAKVDQDWKNAPTEKFAPDMAPQSHIANARTNPDWHHESAGKHIKGRLHWFSRPLTIVIGDYDDGIGTQSGHLVSTIEVNSRFGNNNAGQGGVKPKSAGKEQLWFPVHLLYFLIAGLFCLALCLCCLSRQNSSNKGFTLADDEEDEEFVFDPQPYSDKDSGDAEVELQSMS